MRGYLVLNVWSLHKSHFTSTMPTPSSFPDIEIPNVDLWDLMFERDRDFPNDKGKKSEWHVLQSPTKQAGVREYL